MLKDGNTAPNSFLFRFSPKFPVKVPAILFPCISLCTILWIHVDN